MNTSLCSHHRHKQKGVGLVEILITIVLLAIGFLAAARMQVEGMRFSQSAYYQSQAYFLASDMINRMRTNSDGVQDGDYNDIETSSEAVDPGCGSEACNPSDIALQDVFEWSGYFHSQEETTTNFIAALPSSDSIQAYATVATLDNEIYSVTLLWSEIIGGTHTAQTLSVNFALGSN